MTGESLPFSLKSRQLVKFLCSSDSVECHASDHWVCGEWDTIRMLMCWECSCFFPGVACALTHLCCQRTRSLLFICNSNLYLHTFVTEICKRQFYAWKGRITLQLYLLSVQLLDNLARIPFSLCLWFSLSVRNRTCIVLSAENQILVWYISFSLPPPLPTPQCSKYGSTLKLSALQNIRLQHIAGIQFINC